MPPSPQVASNTVFGEYTPPAGTIDARPILARNASNLWERTEALRSALRARLDAECRLRKIDALVLESPPYVHPAWVKFESWLPVEGQSLTRRASMTITVTAKPYHRFEAVYKVEWSWEGATGVIDHLHTFGDVEIAEVLGYIMSEREPTVFGVSNSKIFKSLQRRQLRLANWIVWKPKNDVNALRADYASVGAKVIMFVGTLMGVLMTLKMNGGGYISGGSFFIPIALFVIGAVILAQIKQGGRLVRSAGKPLAEPRSLRYLDSWQTVIFGAGDNTTEIRTRALELLSSPQLTRAACTTEKIWYWGLEGKEEREQIVLRYGRAMVFVQIYRYGADTYVGWDAQMNVGVWMEKHLQSGVEVATGRRVELKTVVQGVQATTEYDLIDLNCIAEWTHAQVTQVLRQYLKERKIDQEIDFKIIRGERQGIGKTDEEKPLRKLFKRTE